MRCEVRAPVWPCYGSPVRVSPLAVGLASLLVASAAGAQDAKPDAGKTAPAEDPPKSLTMSVGPSATGAWTMTLTNEGPSPLRVPADARLLYLEVVGPPEPPPAEGEKRKPKKPEIYVRGKIPVCRMPASMRPAGLDPERIVVLRPGDSYVETFDPIAFCGAGKLAAEIAPGAIVYANLGWPEVAAPAWHKPKKPEEPKPPFVAESLKDPWDVPPLKVLHGASIVVPRAPAPEPPKDDANKPGDDAVVDERAARLAITAQPFADAVSAEDVTVTTTIKNVGKRPATVHLRVDDVQFRVEPPHGPPVVCDRGSGRRASARDFFEGMKPGEKRAFTIRLREVCPVGTFDRPGVYRATPFLELRDGGERYRLAALVGTSAGETTTRIRVQTGRHRYHADPPRVQRAAAPAAQPATGE